MSAATLLSVTGPAARHRTCPVLSVSNSTTSFSEETCKDRKNCALLTYRGTVYWRGWDAGRLPRNEAFNHQRYRPFSGAETGSSQVCTPAACPGSELRQPAVDYRLLVSLKGKNEQIERRGEICRQRDLRPVQSICGDPRKNCR